MKILEIIIILVFLGLTACNSVGVKPKQQTGSDITEVVITKPDSLSETGAYKTSSSQKMREYSQDNTEDSLSFIRILNSALAIADEQKNKDNFSLHSDRFDINYGYIFSSTKKHLIIKRYFPSDVFVDIFKLQDSSFINVCSKNISALAYIGDTIQDVNGDNRLDYLFHWYPMAGCCLRDIFDVYLQKINGDFADEVEFINPIFSANEKIIRGLCYGQEAPLYKYKWNGYKTDTIEYVYFPDSLNGNHFIKRRSRNEEEKGEVMEQLPNEYRKIGFGYK